MNYLSLLILSLAVGAIPGYFLRNYRRLWSIADLAWVGAAIVTAYFAMVGLNKLSTSADRTSYMKTLAADRDDIRLSTFGLENKYCQPTKVKSAKNVLPVDQQHQSFCATLRKILFVSSLTRFSEADATRLAKEVESFQGKYLPDGSANLIGSLREYARFCSLRKEELEINPYQELVDASDRFITWIYVLMFLLAFRSGKTFAEIGRLEDETR